MSEVASIRLQLIALAIQTGVGADGVVQTAESFEKYVNGGTTVAAADKPAKPKAVAAKAPAAASAPAEAGKAIETAESPAVEIPAGPAITIKEVTDAVIALVNAGNLAAGDEKTGRQYAAAVLQPFGANKVSVLKAEDYPKVLEALKAKLATIKAEADIAG